MKIKILLLFCLFISGIFSSCSTDKIVDPGNGTPANNLSGSISNWPSQILILRALVFNNPNSAEVGADTVLANGQFNINLTTPPPAILQPVNVSFGIDGLTISDTTAFVAFIGNLRAYNLTNTLTGFVQRRNFDTAMVSGSFEVFHFFSDRNTNVNGTAEFINPFDTLRYTVNLNFVTGWNKYYVRLLSETPTLKVYEMKNGEPAGGFWYYYPASLADNRHRFFLGIKPD